MCSLIRQEQASIRQERRLHWCYSLNTSIKDLWIVLKRYQILKILVIMPYSDNKIFKTLILRKKNKNKE